jgi:hypothetical protein
MIVKFPKGKLDTTSMAGLVPVATIDPAFEITAPTGLLTTIGAVLLVSEAPLPIMPVSAPVRVCAVVLCVPAKIIKLAINKIPVILCYG